MIDALPPLAQRWLQRWGRHRHWLALASFAAGVASYLLVQRQERVAQSLIVLLPLSWALAVGETLWLRHRQHEGWWRRAQPLARYLNQAIHQEAFFFTLPFFLATTSWHSSQTLFVVVLGALALASMIDPLYYGAIVVRAPLLWLFHAAAAFITVLTAAPMLWQIRAATSLGWAIAVGSVVAVPMFAAIAPRMRRGRWPLAVVLSVLLAGALWQARGAIPPAPLRVYGARACLSLDEERRIPGDEITLISGEALRTRGLYAWTPIDAPRGLEELVEHQWWHDGQLVDRIPIQIHGGRHEGYRAWTHKTAFGEHAEGRWEVRVVTQSDQLIGQLRFSVQ